MDPRKARDPRLARAQVKSGQPAPTSTPPPASYSFSFPQWSENGVGSASPPTQPAYQPPQPTPSNSSSFSAEFTAPPSLLDATPETSQYKPRPLFCVVCASNQASN
jgi:hypothetical protein